MSLERERHQKPARAGLDAEGRAEGPRVGASGESPTATNEHERSGTDHLMEEAVGRENVLAAIKRVRSNKGSPGIDGMTVDELVPHLVGNWREISARLLDGTYEPQAVRKVEIPKPGGGTRMLGIPTVVDRLVQQCILQVLQERFDPTFSDSSYGLRPGRGAHDAVCAAQRYIQSGKRWVVDVDLEKFFDRVNHDVLMGRLEKRIADKRMLAIIRRFLTAGMMADGVVIERQEGTPQGGPLSPLLANVLLDEVDKALESRGHAFARYADNCNVYVSSKRAGEDVMKLLRQLFAALRLKVNESKSAVARPWERKFLGYSFWVAAGKQVRRRIAPKAIERMKERVREVTARNGGRSLARVVEELGAAGMEGLLPPRRHAEGLPRPGRVDPPPSACHPPQAMEAGHDRVRGATQARRHGRSRETIAANTRSWWKNASLLLNSILTVSYFDPLGVPRLA